MGHSFYHYDNLFLRFFSRFVKIVLLVNKEKHAIHLFLPGKAIINMSKKIDLSVEILGVTVSGTNRNRVLRRILLQRKNLLHLATVNPEFVMQAKNNKKFAKVLEDSEVTVADGWGIVWAARILKSRKIDRITGVDIVNEILKWSQEQYSDTGKKTKIFLLGAREGVAEQAAKAMTKKYPDVNVGWYEGARHVVSEKRAEMGLTLAKINGFEPDFLLVAYGSPWQDIWIEENREYLRARVAMGVGGTLDEWAGKSKPGPAWMDKVGLKWLWRLMTEPWRFARQKSIWKFAILVWWEKLKIMFH